MDVTAGIAIAIARTHNLGWRDSSEAFEFDKYIIIYRILWAPEIEVKKKKTVRETTCSIL